MILRDQAELWRFRLVLTNGPNLGPLLTPLWQFSALKRRREVLLVRMLVALRDRLRLLPATELRQDLERHVHQIGSELSREVAITNLVTFPRASVGPSFFICFQGSALGQLTTFERRRRTVPDTDEEVQKLVDQLSRLYPDPATMPPVRWPFFLSELNHPRRMETIWDGLRGRGDTTAEAEKIMSGNWYRLFGEVWPD